MLQEFIDFLVELMISFGTITDLLDTISEHSMVQALPEFLMGFMLTFIRRPPGRSRRPDRGRYHPDIIISRVVKQIEGWRYQFQYWQRQRELDRYYARDRPRREIDGARVWAQYVLDQAVLEREAAEREVVERDALELNALEREALEQVALEQDALEEDPFEQDALEEDPFEQEDALEQDAI